MRMCTRSCENIEVLWQEWRTSRVERDEREEQRQRQSGEWISIPSESDLKISQGWGLQL